MTIIFTVYGTPLPKGSMYVPATIWSVPSLAHALGSDARAERGKTARQRCPQFQRQIGHFLECFGSASPYPLL